MSEEPVVRLQGVGKRYRLGTGPLSRLRRVFGRESGAATREFWALRDLDLSVPRGAVLGLIGDNGAGKSTALKIVAGKLRPTCGTVEVRGQVSSILELGTGLQPALTGRENARLNALFLGYDPLGIEDKLDQILEFAELGEHAEQPLDTYSSGMKARLAFSVLTCLTPELLVLDEALATGDVHFAQKCKAFIRNLCASGCTVLIASHDLGFVSESCDQVMWLEHGRVRASGEPHEVVATYTGQSPEQLGRLIERPKNLLFRFTPAEGDDPQLLVHGLEWLDPEGAFQRGFYVGTLGAFSEGLVAACQAGLSGQAARAGWLEPGVVDFNQSTYRHARPAAGAGGSLHFALPVPPPPTPSPRTVRVGVCARLERPLTFSVFVDGSWVTLGELGTPAPGDPEHGWVKRDFALPAEVVGG